MKRKLNNHEQPKEKKRKVAPNWNLLFVSSDISGEIISYLKCNSRYFLSCASQEFADIVYRYLAIEYTSSIPGCVLDHVGAFSRLIRMCPMDMRAHMLSILSKYSSPVSFGVICFMIDNDLVWISKGGGNYYIPYESFSSFVLKCIELSMDNSLRQLLNIKGYWGYDVEPSAVISGVNNAMYACSRSDRHVCAKIILEHSFGAVPVHYKEMNGKLMLCQPRHASMWLDVAISSESENMMSLIMSECHEHISVLDLSIVFEECCQWCDISIFRILVSHMNFRREHVSDTALLTLLSRKRSKHLDLLGELNLLSFSISSAAEKLMSQDDLSQIQYLADGHWADGVDIKYSYKCAFASPRLAYSLYANHVLAFNNIVADVLRMDFSAWMHYLESYVCPRRHSFPHQSPEESEKQKKLYDFLLSLVEKFPISV